MTNILKAKIKNDHRGYILNYSVKNESTVSIEQIYLDNTDRIAYTLPEDVGIRDYGELGIGKSSNQLEELTVYRQAVTEKGIETDGCVLNSYDIENPGTFDSYLVANQATVKEIALCMVNNYFEYTEATLFSVLSDYEEGCYSLLWFQRCIGDYLAGLTEQYENEQLDGESITTVCSPLEQKEISEAVLYNYSDEEFDIISELENPMQHYICKIEDTVNAGVVASPYYDCQTMQQAKRYFLALPKVQQYMNQPGYRISFQPNEIVLKE